MECPPRDYLSGCKCDLEVTQSDLLVRGRLQHTAVVGLQHFSSAWSSHEDRDGGETP